MGWDKLGPALRDLNKEILTARGRAVISNYGNNRAPNPHLNTRVRNMGFFGNDTGRLLSGWATASGEIDEYLASDLVPLRARSRELVRKTPFGKQFVRAMKNNIVGPSGVMVQAQSLFLDRKTGEYRLDTLANDAIDNAAKDWADYHCDWNGKRSFTDFQNLAVASVAQDGEFIIREHVGSGAGKYAYQLEAIDAQELDISKNEITRNGEIRLGVEYNKRGKVIRYHFAKKRFQNGYSSVERYTVDAKYIIHGFLEEWANQSRGVPWMHASLERSKHLDKFDEGAIVNARVGASSMGIIHGEGDGQFTGEEDGEGDYEGDTLTEFSPGEFKDIGNRQITHLDSKYPDAMYDPFVKRFLHSIAAGWGISYHSMTGDLEGVNFSSIRAGVLDDREVYKGLQNWFIRISVRRIRENWLGHAYLTGNIKIGNKSLSRPIDQYKPAHYQGRRWAWVDPQKDGAANQLAIDNRTRSRSSIIRDMGDDPESVWREIHRETEMMKALGIQPIEKEVTATEPKEDQDDD